MQNSSIESDLLFAQNAITNASKHEKIKTALAEYTYDEARLQEGDTLQKTAAKLQARQVKEYGDQYAATDALNLAKAEANRKYITHVKIGRVALKDDRGASASLLLNGKRKRSLPGWLKQANAFYANSLADEGILTAFGKFGITQEKLEAGQVLVKEVETKYNEQLIEMGEAQDATKARDNAFDELEDWMEDFLVIARIALESNPQYLEMLGINEPS